MDYKTKKVDGSQIEFTITVTPEEYEEDVEKAAKILSQNMDIDGFRKGKAPLDVVKKKAGEMQVMQQALQTIVQRTYFKAVEEEEVDTIGQPEVNVEKMAPGNDVVYKAKVAIMPEIDLADATSIEVEKNTSEVQDQDIQDSLDSLRNMHAEETKKEGPAKDDDKLVMDMNMTVDGVPIEGGQTKDYQVYLDGEQHIPGFNEEVEGLQTGDEKKFSLDFPENHYQKNLAGKTVDFDVKIKDVFKRELPELNDEFAQKLGQDSVEDIKNLVTQNLEQEAKQKASQQFEIAVLNKMVEESDFGEIPEVLIDSEKQRMFQELKNDLEKNGITVEQYLEDLKKTEEELLEGFTEQATKRAKTSLVSRKLAEEHEELQPTEEEINEEIDKIRQANEGNEEVEEKLQNQEVIQSIATTVQNQKVVKWLKDQVQTKEVETEK